MKGGKGIGSREKGVWSGEFIKDLPVRGIMGV